MKAVICQCVICVVYVMYQPKGWGEGSDLSMCNMCGLCYVPTYRVGWRQ